VLQPGTQMPAGPLQTRPDIGPPHSPSPSVSVQPHVSLAVKQMGRGNVQRVMLVPEHSVHAP
jgi:hypothetical protein